MAENMAEKAKARIISACFRKMSNGRKGRVESDWYQAICFSQTLDIQSLSTVVCSQLSKAAWSLSSKLLDVSDVVPRMAIQRLLQPQLVKVVPDEANRST
eukprot:s3968_g12.t1